MHTEKQMERWLESETRNIAMPDGDRRFITMFRLFWKSYDSLITLSGYTPEQISGWAVEEAGLQGMEFQKAFEGVIAWLDDQRQRRWSRVKDT